eukprot:IDg22977t1
MHGTVPAHARCVAQASAHACEGHILHALDESRAAFNARNVGAAVCTAACSFACVYARVAHARARARPTCLPCSRPATVHARRGLPRDARARGAAFDRALRANASCAMTEGRKEGRKEGSARSCFPCVGVRKLARAECACACERGR